MKAPVPESGKHVPISKPVAVKNTVILVIWLLFILFLTFVGGAISVFTLINGDGPLLLGILLGLPLLFGGIAIIVFIFYMQGMVVLGLIKGEWLVMGEYSLQRVIGESMVVDHIPYDNIDKMRVLDVTEQRGAHQVIVTKVSILLVEPDAKDTIIRASMAFSPGKREGEYYIEPVFKATPEQIHQMLRKRWKRFQDEMED